MLDYQCGTKALRARPEQTHALRPKRGLNDQSERRKSTEKCRKSGYNL